MATKITPTTQNPRNIGRGLGRAYGRGIGRGGTSECVCPNCGNTVAHPRGIPCSTIKCSKCDTPMRGDFCR